MRAAGAVAAAVQGATPTGTLTAVPAAGTALGAEAAVGRPPNDALAAANHARSEIARPTITIHPAASTIGNHGKLLFRMMCIAGPLSFSFLSRISTLCAATDFNRRPALPWWTRTKVFRRWAHNRRRPPAYWQGNHVSAARQDRTAKEPSGATLTLLVRGQLVGALPRCCVPGSRRYLELQRRAVGGRRERRWALPSHQSRPGRIPSRQQPDPRRSPGQQLGHRRQLNQPVV